MWPAPIKDPKNQRNKSRILRQGEFALERLGAFIPELELEWLDNFKKSQHRLLYGAPTRRDGFWDSTKIAFEQKNCDKISTSLLLPLPMFSTNFLCKIRSLICPNLGLPFQRCTIMLLD
jgi:hypothetical protein